MNEAALPLLDRMEAIHATNRLQSNEQADVASTRAEYLRKLGGPAPTSWRNQSELDQIVTLQLVSGRAESAAALLEQARIRRRVRRGRS